MTARRCPTPLAPAFMLAQPKAFTTVARLSVPVNPNCEMRVVGFTPPNGPPQRDIAGLQPLHEHVVALLGASCENLYKGDE
jgi:hypothetical protein